MRISEKVLSYFSRDPDRADLNAMVNIWNEENSFELLDTYIPNFRSFILNNSFVDFGCGVGEQSFALVRAGASFVLGIDINPTALRQMREKAVALGFEEKIEAIDKISDEHTQRYDFVISQNSMEHFPDPKLVLDQMASLLKPGGRILMTFGPPWYAPYGSHMHFFTKIPWVNILFSEKTVMNVRSRYRDDGARRYEDVAYGLNKMTVQKFENLIKESGLSFEYRHYVGVKKLDFLTQIPLLRELFTNHISCVLLKT